MVKACVMPTHFPVACHTDNVGPRSTFVAIPGMKANGVDYICAALEKGASTIVVTETATLTATVEAAIQQARAKLVRVPDTRKALAELSAQAAGYPAKNLKLIAITGTKGKTTSSFLLAHLLEQAGYCVALLTTAGNRIAGVALPTALTTQQPDYLHQFFKLCVEQGVTHVVMEVAAQAVTLHRIAGLTFDALLFTNFSEEHGEFYTTMPDYFAAKCALFSYRKPGAPAVINSDDAWCAALAQRYIDCFNVSLLRKDVPIEGVFDTHTGKGTYGTVRCFEREYPVACPALVGNFNAYNIAGVLGVASLLGVTPEIAHKALQLFPGVPGRLVRFDLANGASCYIDYAHNPSSYEAVLSTLRQLTNHLIVIFGAGGERDRAKRPVMGAIAARYADIVMITSDNPRSEKPEQIVEDICAGISPEQCNRVIKELDRELAIRYAYRLSKAGSVIAVLGKGTDEYQMIGTVKTPFSETAIIRSL